jgi:penicillin amidase
MTRKVLLLLSVILMAAVAYFYSVAVGSLPPAGDFFHPTRGFWANAEISDLNAELDLNFDAVSEPVEIYYDERGVPHIFAQNDRDLYFAQGYVTARDRLFQMELQIRAAGGYLAEWLGDDLVEYDKNQRRLGMVYGAERAVEYLNQNDTSRQMVQAYADGVNAYINSLSYESFPLEYKVLNAEPQQWKPLHTALLLKYMTQMLAGRSNDVRVSNTKARFGVEFVNEYLSNESTFFEPIVPSEKEWDFDAMDVDAPDSLFTPGHVNQIESWQPDPLNGSNNWVVDSTKSANGYPLLSNDMHLNMTVPSIWYEIQLHSPDVNVYGVALQGTPTVIVGFNESMAWGSTNTGADVMDWYEIEFRDESKQEYLHNGEWKPVTRRVEKITTKSGEILSDTLLFTHHGPVYESNRETPVTDLVQKDHALRWIAHDPSNELLTFYKLNRGIGYEDFKNAFRTYKAPAQNMNFADTTGNIAIQTGGLFPLKWKYQGRSVSDGRNPNHDWQGFIPYEQNPYSLNPERGFLSAANQAPVDESYPYYLGEQFAPFERGRRINDLLGRMNDITVEDYKEMLMDNFSYHAFRALPVMLQELDRSILDADQIRWISDLEAWNFRNDGDLVQPSVFKTWWDQLYHAIWNNKYNSEYPMEYPGRDRTVDLIVESRGSVLLDDIETEKKEDLGDLVTASYIRAIQKLREDYGEPDEGWQWGNVNRTDLDHLGQIPGLGVMDVFTGGGAESLNAIRGSHGPSWRMVVELDPNGVRGYGVYPGGQSGNPGSKTYDEFVETWRTGELFELDFMKQKPDSSDNYPLVVRFE